MARVAHFSINAGDVNRARKFYEQTFGWKFEAWGPPGFYMILMEGKDESKQAVRGSLQKRREIVTGVPIHGYECTISVSSIDETIRAVEKNGGTIVMPKSTIVGVGTLAFFRDTEGNIAGAIEYDANAE